MESRSGGILDAILSTFLSLFSFFYFFYFFHFFQFFFRKSPLFIFLGSRYLYIFDFCHFFIFAIRLFGGGGSKMKKGGGGGGSGWGKMKKVEKIAKSDIFVGAK